MNREDDGDDTVETKVKLIMHSWTWLVLSDDKRSDSVRMDFFLPFGALVLCDVLFCPADLGSSFEINIDMFNPTSLIFLRKVR